MADTWDPKRLDERACDIMEMVSAHNRRFVTRRRGFFEGFERHYVRGSDRFNPPRRGIAINRTVAESPYPNAFNDGT